jgi:hypothetical protein
MWPSPSNHVPHGAMPDVLTPARAASQTLAYVLPSHPQDS